MDAPPPRTALLVARDRPVAVLLSRGPSGWCRLATWRTEDDVVEPGQWLHARVLPRRCDLSPDGRLLALFAFDGSPRRQATSWVAISRPPWASALAWWAVGGTYATGAMFPSSASLWTGWTDPPDGGDVPGWLALADTGPAPDGTPGWTDRTVLHARLRRDGWVAEEVGDDRWSRPCEAGSLVAERPHLPLDPSGARPAWRLRTIDGHEVALDVDEAGVGDRGRLIAARGRALLAWEDNRLIQVAALPDEPPTPRPAPPEATRWPPPPT